MNRRNRKAFSMVELLLGIGIFGLAILPLIWLGHNQTKGAYSVGKHMMAGQIATSFLDEKLKLSFEDCLKEMKSLKGKKEKILDNEHLMEMVQGLDSETATNDMETSFRNFYYSFTYDYSDASSEKILRVNIEVFYRVVENDKKTEQSVKLSALKFGDKNG